METNKRLISLILAVVIVVLGAAFVLWLRAQNGSFRKVEPITIGTGANAGDTLIFIADEQKYFADNGLNVTLKAYVNGLASTNGMLGGEADLAYATESITIADISDQASALVHIADDRGFFLRNGLRVNLQNYGNGVLAIRAMKSDEAHVD